LARIAVLPSEQKRRRLEEMKLSRPPHTLKPFRMSVLDIVNATAGPLAPGPRTPWHKIARAIRRLSQHPSETRANLAVAKGLYRYAVANALRGVRREFLPLSIRVSERVVYWSPVLLELHGRPVVPFFEARRTKGLTAEGRRFVFSVMHERIRALEPDLSDVQLAIVQFGPEEKIREPKFHLDTDVQLFTFEALDHMIRETYQLWSEVREDVRRRGTGTRGELL
jgi:hypothetical protein